MGAMYFDGEQLSRFEGLESRKPPEAKSALITFYFVTDRGQDEVLVKELYIFVHVQRELNLIKLTVAGLKKNHFCSPRTL